MTTVLELKSVRKCFGTTEIVGGVDLAVCAGERLGIIGPNGAGKSTLFNLISGALVPSGGDIVLLGRSVVGRKPHQIFRMGLSRSFQITNVFPGLSVFENLRCALLWGLGYKYTFLKLLANARDANERAHDLMHSLGLVQKRDVLAMHLSYAEQRALEIGMTVGGSARVILLDEPTAGMSRSETTRFIELIRKLTVGRTLLMIEHDMSVVFGLADRIAVMVGGQLLACGAPDAVRANALVQQAYLGAGIGLPHSPATP